MSSYLLTYGTVRVSGFRGLLPDSKNGHSALCSVATARGVIFDVHIVRSKWTLVNVPSFSCRVSFVQKGTEFFKSLDLHGFVSNHKIVFHIFKIIQSYRGVARVIFSKIKSIDFSLTEILRSLYFSVLFLKDWLLQEPTSVRSCGINYTYY